MNHPRKGFQVVDLTGTGEIRLRERYEYETLERIEGASELIGIFSSWLWRAPDAFELPVPGGALNLRWRACSESSGLATLRERERLLRLCVLLSGQGAEDDLATLKPLQLHLVRELHDTGYEPAFDLMSLTERPLLASMSFVAPVQEGDRRLFALCDRCFAASYFRKMGLA
jgi:hypothetical protein